MAMTLSKLVLRSMRKNLKHYYLYFFALIFSVTLCFSFTTLRYNPTVQEAIKESGTAYAGFGAGGYILYFIVTFFVLYANHLFMKRRSKEFGLFQLIGMTKGLVVRLIALENIILFVLAISLGMIIGFFSSRLFAMILIKMLGADMIVHLSFSQEAFKQSVIIFSILLVVILLQMTWLIRSVSLLSLFNTAKRTDERVKRFSIFHMVMGLLGLLLIVYGYYQSTLLFDAGKSDFFNNLMLHMVVILGTTILGTFFVFRYSVALIMNMLRGSKKGHLNITDVLAVTPIMHRMKGNSKSLTLITVLTGLSVGITSLSYISYYSSETNARQSSPYDYILLNNQGIEFLDQLTLENIEYEKETYDIASVMLDIKDLVDDNLKNSPLFSEETATPVIPLSQFQQVEPSIQLKEGEAFVTSYVNLLSEILPLKKEQSVKVSVGGKDVSLFIKDIREDYLLSSRAMYGGPILVVPDKLFEEINTANEQHVIYSQIGINLAHGEDMPKAEEIYSSLAEERQVVLNDKNYTQSSYEQLRKNNIAIFGLTIFITAFLGLAFLLTTGSILYFKQMAEAEEEKASYMILRKIGFSSSHIMKGIYAKQAFNFGVPLIIGLLHSYFAVKSGWWLFGTELVAPLVITMCLYVMMYAVFMVLSIGYYKKVIRESL